MTPDDGPHEMMPITQDTMRAVPGEDRGVCLLKYHAWLKEIRRRERRQAEKLDAHITFAQKCGEPAWRERYLAYQRAEKKQHWAYRVAEEFLDPEWSGTRQLWSLCRRQGGPDRVPGSRREKTDRFLRKWRIEELSRLAARLEAGTTMPHLVLEFGRTPIQLRYAATWMGLRVPKSSRWTPVLDAQLAATPKGATHVLAAIAAVTGVSLGHVYHRRTMLRRRQGWLPRERV